MGNGGDGIWITDATTRTQIKDNLIVFNAGAGVGLSKIAGRYNAIADPNIIFGNGGLAIDLGEDGVTPNDPGDADTGPNDYQNYPVITKANLQGTQLLVEGVLETNPTIATYYLEFFSTSSTGPAGSGQGEFYLGYLQVNTNSQGIANFSLTFSNPQGLYVAVTATRMEDLDGNPGTPLEWSDTSEFSQAVLMSPSLSINDITAAETNSGTTPFTFTVTLSNSNDQAVTVDYTVLDGTATLADNDFVAASDTLTFAPFQTSQTITVQVKGDIKYETAETFTVLLSNPTNAAIADNSLTGTITNDDSTPAMSIGDVSQAEGNSGTTNFNFTVSLSAASYQTITVNYATANGSASAPGDFTALSGALTFNPGELTKTVTVSVVGDTVQEANENFTVNLSGAVNATVTDALGVGTILNDDATISINDVSRLEGPGASQIYIFTVSLSGMSGVPVTLDYASANGTATAGSDYTAVSGSLTFTPGQLTKMIAVTVFGDLIFEPNETLFIDLTNILGAAALDSQGLGTILNDD